MFACMVGQPPQPADQRRKEDKMEPHFEKLEALYSKELVHLVRWTLQIDPLARPQSLFELQKLLQQTPTPPSPPSQPGALEKLGKLAGKLGFGRKKDGAPRTER
jgi:serine/threonine protein kinase